MLPGYFQELNPEEADRSYSGIYGGGTISGGTYSRSMLGSAYCWLGPNNGGIGEHMTIDGGAHQVFGVVTQGCGAGSDRWVTAFKVAVSVDGDSFEYVDEAEIFPGNSDTGTKAYHYFRTPYTARYVRFYPVTWTLTSYLALRAGAARIEQGTTVAGRLSALWLRRSARLTRAANATAATVTAALATAVAAAAPAPAPSAAATLAATTHATAAPATPHTPPAAPPPPAPPPPAPHPAAPTNHSTPPVPPRPYH